MSNKHLNASSKEPQGPTKGKLRLYSNRFCPHAQRVRLVLDAKKIPYDIVNINLASKPDWLYEKSYQGKIPALQIDNTTISDSLIICEYLDEKYPKNQLNSEDLLQKAKDRMILEEFKKVIYPMYKVLINPHHRYFDEVDCVSKGLDFLELELSKRSSLFYCGDKPGMLDYMIWPWCERADLLKVIGTKYTLNKLQYKNLVNWRERMLEDSVVKKNYLDIETHGKFINSFRAGVPDYDILL